MRGAIRQWRTEAAIRRNYTRFGKRIKSEVTDPQRQFPPAAHLLLDALDVAATHALDLAAQLEVVLDAAVVQDAEAVHHGEAAPDGADHSLGSSSRALMPFMATQRSRSTRRPSWRLKKRVLPWASSVSSISGQTSR